MDTTKNFQWLIQYAIDNNIQLRALGNGWSFSRWPFANGGLVDTKALRLSYNLKNSFVAPEYLQSGKTGRRSFFYRMWHEYSWISMKNSNRIQTLNDH